MLWFSVSHFALTPATRWLALIRAKALFSQIFKIEMVVKHALHRKDNIWNSQKLLISVLKAYARGRTQRIWIACFLLTEFKGQKNKTCFLSQFGAVFCVCDVYTLLGHSWNVGNLLYRFNIFWISKLTMEFVHSHLDASQWLFSWDSCEKCSDFWSIRKSSTLAPFFSLNTQLLANYDWF